MFSAKSGCWSKGSRNEREYHAALGKSSTHRPARMSHGESGSCASDSPRPRAWALKYAVARRTSAGRPWGAPSEAARAARLTPSPHLIQNRVVVSNAPRRARRGARSGAHLRWRNISIREY
eukprot:scaffold1594_cov401-Prasinococcus_capsulatus_cf.AAC.16